MFDTGGSGGLRLTVKHNFKTFRTLTMSQIYTGPIYDGDTHIYEQTDAWSRYLPEQYKKDFDVRHVVEGDKYPLYVGKWKIPPGEDAFRLGADGKVKIPAPGMLHVWLKRLHEG